MKFNIKIIFIALLISSLTDGISQNNINWISWNTMIQQRAVDSIKKKVFIDFYTNWCGWCKRMDVSTFSDPVIVNYIKNNFYTVKFNGETKDTIVFTTIIFTILIQPIKNLILILEVKHIGLHIRYLMESFLILAMFY